MPDSTPHFHSFPKWDHSLSPTNTCQSILIGWIHHFRRIQENVHQYLRDSVQDISVPLIRKYNQYYQNVIYRPIQFWCLFRNEQRINDYNLPWSLKINDDFDSFVPKLNWYLKSIQGTLIQQVNTFNGKPWSYNRNNLKTLYIYSTFS